MSQMRHGEHPHRHRSGECRSRGVSLDSLRRTASQSETRDENEKILQQPACRSERVPAAAEGCLDPGARVPGEMPPPASRPYPVPSLPLGVFGGCRRIQRR